MEVNLPNPRVSVVIPCYNHASFIAESVESILSQTLKDFELIVVDDASKDASVTVLQEFAERDPRLKLIVHERNCGAARTRNDGIRAARGEYLAFCDADDLWATTKLERQINLMVENLDYDVTYCESEIIDENGKSTEQLFSDLFPLPSVASGSLFKELCIRNFINTQTVLVRREALGESIFFDESIKWVEDWWQWIRLSHQHLFLFERESLAKYRVHQKSTGFTQKKGISKNRWRVCKRNLRTHHDLPRKLSSHLWYHMASELSILGRPRLAAKFYCRAFYLGLTGRSNVKDLIKMGWRCKSAAMGFIRLFQL